jgi:hypothetical protein
MGRLFSYGQMVLSDFVFVLNIGMDFVHCWMSDLARIHMLLLQLLSQYSPSAVIAICNRCETSCRPSIGSWNKLWVSLYRLLGIEHGKGPGEPVRPTWPKVLGNAPEQVRPRIGDVPQGLAAVKQQCPISHNGNRFGALLSQQLCKLMGHSSRPSEGVTRLALRPCLP